VLKKMCANNFRLELPTIVRLHPVFHVKKFRPCSNATLRPSAVHGTIHEDDDLNDIDLLHF
jgi:hypothetical protein